MTLEPPTFLHDTKNIIWANAAACALFRCDLEALVDLDMMELLVDEDFRGLARLRMSMLRDNKKVRPMSYMYRRCDGTAFRASVDSRNLGGGEYETVLTYEGEA